LSEWQCQPAYVIPIAKYVTTPEGDDEPSYATQFIVKLRVEHQHIFYVWQVLFPALLMTIASVTPLAMPPMQDDMGDRLSVYGGGLLTLVAFKYGVADHLPSVPYATFVDYYLTWQVVCVSFCALESVVSFHLILGGVDHEGDDVFWNLDKTENLMFYVLVGVWFLYFVYLCCYMPTRKLDWRDVFGHSAEKLYFERASLDNSRQPENFPQKAKFIVLRDGLAVWDLKTGRKLSQLKARTVVRAREKLTSTAATGRKFYSKDDKLYTEDEFMNKFPADWEKPWENDCAIAAMMPIEKDNGNEWGAIEVHRFRDAKPIEPTCISYDKWENVRLLEKDAVTDEERTCSSVATLRGRCCQSRCCCKCSSPSTKAAI
jgi:hypothetical protein